LSNLFEASSAIISDCGRYRYRLERDGPGEGRTVVIMVNPSTADADTDDATIRKLKGFGARNGWGRIIVGNLFAYRATDVRELGRVDDPIGRPENWRHLIAMLGEADRIIAAWGPVTKQPKHLRDTWRDIPHLAGQWGKRLLSIGAPAKCGHPKHPLMLAYDTPIVPWSPPNPSAAGIAPKRRAARG
jgi:hypothetical protein